MKTKYTISVLLIAFLMAFSIPIFGGPHSTINNNTKMGIQTSDLTPDVEIEDFSSEEHGTTGLDIDFIDEYHGYVSVYCDQYVNDGPFGTHSKVLYARDAQSGMNTWSVHYLNNPLTHGTIEFSLWLNPGSSCNSPHYHYLKFRTFSDITAFEFRFNLENGNVEYTDGSSYSSNILNLDTAKWYDYEITIDVSLGLYDLRCSEEGTQIEYIEDIIKDYVAQMEHTEKFKKTLDIISNSMKIFVKDGRVSYYKTIGEYSEVPRTMQRKYFNEHCKYGIKKRGKIFIERVSEILIQF